VGERLQARGRQVAERSQCLSDRISWLTISTDRSSKLGALADQDDRRSLAEVEDETRGLGADASRLAAPASPSSDARPAH
jgi:hypothetical protein